jgi:hypothetical protein
MNAVSVVIALELRQLSGKVLVCVDRHRSNIRDPVQRNDRRISAIVLKISVIRSQMPPASTECPA